MKYILILLIGLTLSCKPPITLFTASEVQTSGDVVIMNVDESAVKTLNTTQKKEVEVFIPSAGILLLHRQDLFTNDYKVRTDKGKAECTKGTYYSGTIKGDSNSIANISIQDGVVGGTISSGGISKDIAPLDGTYGIIMAQPQSFTCMNDRIEATQQIVDRMVAQQVHTSAGNACVSVDFEFTYEVYQAFAGNIQNATNWFNTLFNNVKTIYANEGIDIRIKSMYFWTTPDGYNASPDIALNEVTAKRKSDPAFTANLIHLVRIQNSNLSGIAYINAICSKDYRTGFSQLPISFQTYPTYSWSVMVITHELGHEVGSNHTQWCGWVGGALDNCYTTEGGCSPGAVPVNGGTIMSYCHLTSYGINLTKGFGQQPGDKIRSSISNCGSCTVTPPIPTCSDGIKNGTETGIDCGGNCPPCPITPPVTINLCLNRPTTQSTTLIWNGIPITANRATDGNINTISHTNVEVNPWLRVDIGGKTVNTINITNRVDCCGDRLRRFRVYVTQDTIANFNDTRFVYDWSGIGINGQVFNMPNLNVFGKYITVFVQNFQAGDYFSIGEIAAHGNNTVICKDTMYKVTRDSAGKVCR